MTVIWSAIVQSFIRRKLNYDNTHDLITWRIKVYDVITTFHDLDKHFSHLDLNLENLNIINQLWYQQLQFPDNVSEKSLPPGLLQGAVPARLRGYKYKCTTSSLIVRYFSRSGVWMQRILVLERLMFRSLSCAVVTYYFEQFVRF